MANGRSRYGWDLAYYPRRRGDLPSPFAPPSDYGVSPPAALNKYPSLSGFGSAATPAATTKSAALGWTPFAVAQGLGFAGDLFTSHQRGKERKKAEKTMGQDRSRILAGMNELPYSPGGYQTFAMRSSFNLLDRMAEQMAEIADVNALDVRGSLGEKVALGAQERLGDVWLNSMQERYRAKIAKQMALLQSSSANYQATFG